MNYGYASLIGLISGIISGLFGVGGGVVMVPAMVTLLKQEAKVAVGTSLLVIVPTAIAGASKHYSQGNVDTKLALALVPLAVLGGIGGAWLTNYLSNEMLKRLFGAFIVVVGIKMVLGK